MTYSKGRRRAEATAGSRFGQAFQAGGQGFSSDEHPGRNLQKGQKHESAFLKIGMRQAEIGQLQHKVSVPRAVVRTE